VQVLSAANRRIYNQWQSSLPSRFVDELPDEHVERLADRGLYGGQGESLGSGGLGFERRGFGGWPARRRNTTQDTAGFEAVEHPPDTFAVGLRVFHQKFGYGRITAVEGSKLEIAFEAAGDKKVIDSFVRPA
jgi:DNA helicase-2/ATP-dependent DNA helicase PcrA